MKKGFMDGYKTYDTSHGFGNPNEWRSAFNERMGYKEAQDFLRDVKQEEIPFILEMRAAKTLNDLKAVYREALKLHHPDKGGDTKVAQAIIAMYTTLKEKF